MESSPTPEKEMLNEKTPGPQANPPAEAIAAPAKAPEPHELTVLLEQYKLYVDGLEKLIARRLTMNAFFISINTILLGGAVVTSKAKDVVSVPIALAGGTAMAVAGVMVSLVWRRLLQTYGVISKAKFDILHQIEERLPAKPFLDENKLLEQRNYKSSSATEVLLPFLFGLLYLTVGIVTLVVLAVTLGALR